MTPHQFARKQIEDTINRFEELGADWSQAYWLGVKNSIFNYWYNWLKENK